MKRRTERIEREGVREIGEDESGLEIGKGGDSLKRFDGIKRTSADTLKRWGDGEVGEDERGKEGKATKWGCSLSFSLGRFERAQLRRSPHMKWGRLRRGIETRRERRKKKRKRRRLIQED